MKHCIALLLVAVSCANAHVFLSEPIARTSIQLRPEFGASQPFWWDNFGVWCSNVQQNTAFSTCGRCGEGAGNRDASQGGQFDKGIIVATYTAGSVRHFFFLVSSRIVNFVTRLGEHELNNYFTDC